MIDMAIMWVAVLGGGAFGYYQFLVHDSWFRFLVPFGAGTVFAFLTQVRSQLGLLMSLNRRSRDLQEEMKHQHNPAKS